MKYNKLILLLCLFAGCRFHTEEELANIRNARAAEKQAKQKKIDSVIGSTIISIEDSSTLLKITLSDGRVIIVKNYKFYHSTDVSDLKISKRN